MRIITLETSGGIYTCQVYLVLGSSSRLEDVNTLVDVGQDPAILKSIEGVPIGVGKRPVEQVVLTHCHADHTALLPQVRAAFHPKVFAFSPNPGVVHCLLSDGDVLKMGDESFDVIHMPGHSSDSVCFYNRTEGVLFVGDSPVLTASVTATFEIGFLAAMEKLCSLDVRQIYFGHGAPLMERCNERLRESYCMVKGSRPALAIRRQVNI